jgi:hypothetical protein
MSARWIFLVRSIWSRHNRSRCAIQTAGNVCWWHVSDLLGRSDNVLDRSAPEVTGRIKTALLTRLGRSFPVSLNCLFRLRWPARGLFLSGSSWCNLYLELLFGIRDVPTSPFELMAAIMPSAGIALSWTDSPVVPVSTENVRGRATGSRNACFGRICLGSRTVGGLAQVGRFGTSIIDRSQLVSALGSVISRTARLHMV